MDALIIRNYVPISYSRIHIKHFLTNELCTIIQTPYVYYKFLERIEK